jgi:beta-lactamase superfamily II metal-dependent hydrolase
MRLQIFNVEHGACALLTTSNGRRVMIDCGDNTTTGWEPGSYLASQGITSLDRLIISNYDEDHVSGIANLLAYVNVGMITRNSSVSTNAIRTLKTEDGMGLSIQTLIDVLDNVYTGSVAATDLDFGDTSFELFYNTPSQFDDENNLSLVTFVTCGSRRLVFPGDLEEAGWLTLLRNPTFRSYLTGTDIFVASHHGRESGCCDEVFALSHPEFVIISDASKQHQTQETVPWYRTKTRGFTYNGRQRHVVTTRRDGNIELNFAPTGTTILLENGGV